MTEQRAWYTCPTCNRVLYVGDECDTPECVAAARAKAKPAKPDPAQPPPEPAPTT